jgi:hypothetical protein
VSQFLELPLHFTRLAIHGQCRDCKLFGGPVVASCTEPPTSDCASSPLMSPKVPHARRFHHG